MIETSNFDFQLMEFSDTMGDQALFNNENFKKLDSELLDIESVIEEYIGEEEFENAMSISERFLAIENEFGGQQILRGTQKDNDEFFGDGNWEDGNFKTSIPNDSLMIKEFEDDRIEVEGRPIAQLNTYIHRVGANSSSKEFVETFRQNNIPTQNAGWYTFSFYGKISEYQIGVTGATGLPVTLRVALTLNDSISEDEYEEIVMSSYGWDKYSVIFNTEQLFQSTVEGYYFNEKFYEDSKHKTLIVGTYGVLYTDLNTEKTYYWSANSSSYILLREGRVEEADMKGLFRNFIINDDKNNTFDMCGIQLSQGIYSNDWQLSDNDVLDGDEYLQKQIGDLTTLSTDAKGDLVSAINEVDAHTDNAHKRIDDIIASKGRADTPTPNARIATLDTNGWVPAGQLDADYVHNVRCMANRSSFPSSGESDILYVDMAKDEIYRYNTTTKAYVNLTQWADNTDIDALFG